jgi:hypothetical protein
MRSERMRSKRARWAAEPPRAEEERGVSVERRRRWAAEGAEGAEP